MLEAERVVAADETVGDSTVDVGVRHHFFLARERHCVSTGLLHINRIIINLYIRVRPRINLGWALRGPSVVAHGCGGLLPLLLLFPFFLLALLRSQRLEALDFFEDLRRERHGRDEVDIFFELLGHLSGSRLHTIGSVHLHLVFKVILDDKISRAPAVLDLHLRFIDTRYKRHGHSSPDSIV